MRELTINEVEYVGGGDTLPNGQTMEEWFDTLQVQASIDIANFYGYSLNMSQWMNSNTDDGSMSLDAGSGNAKNVGKLNALDKYLTENGVDYRTRGYMLQVAGAIIALYGTMLSKTAQTGLQKVFATALQAGGVSVGIAGGAIAYVFTPRPAY